MYQKNVRRRDVRKDGCRLIIKIHKMSEREGERVQQNKDVVRTFIHLPQYKIHGKYFRNDMLVNVSLAGMGLFNHSLETNPPIKVP